MFNTERVCYLPNMEQICITVPTEVGVMGSLRYVLTLVAVAVAKAPIQNMN